MKTLKKHGCGCKDLQYDEPRAPLPHVKHTNPEQWRLHAIQLRVQNESPAFVKSFAGLCTQKCLTATRVLNAWSV